MRKWAEIKAGVVHNIYEMPDDLVPQINPNIFRYIREVTTVTPEPEAYWEYDIDTDTYSPPNLVPQETITSKDLWLRFTKKERERMMQEYPVDTKVEQFLMYLQMDGTIYLCSTEIIAIINYLETTSVLASGRAAEILEVIMKHPSEV